MGDCCSRANFNKFHPVFNAHLTELYDYYLKMVQYVRQQHLFAERGSKLDEKVQTYLKLFRQGKVPKLLVDQSDRDICAIDMVHKLHPLDYGTQVVTKQWLLDACLRQNKFISTIRLESLKFQDCYKAYVEFLYICYISGGEVIVPTKMADFMWHSHMQDNQGYQSDMQRMLGRVLNHVDDFSQQDLRKHTQRTEQIRDKIAKFMDKNAVMLPRQPMGAGNNATGLYGECGINARSICGAGSSFVIHPTKIWKHSAVNCGATCGAGGGCTCGGVCGGAHCGS